MEEIIKKIILGTLFILLTSSIAYAKNLVDNVNYDVFTGNYQLEFHDQNGICELNFNHPVTLSSSAKDHNLVASFDNGNKLKLENINQGKQTFNSCWSDGVIGYSETKGEAALVQMKTVFQKPGLLCRGAQTRYTTKDTWEIKGDLLILTHQKSDVEGKVICKFKKI